MNMTVAEMLKRKKQLGLSNRQVADLSGVPLGTVQKVFAGVTDAPRYQTLRALSKVFEERSTYDLKRPDDIVCEAVAVYGEEPSDYADKTIDDYIALPEGIRVELIDGTFYDMAAPNTIHQRITMMISGLLQEYIRNNKGSCIVFPAPTDVQLDCDDKTMVQPDVLVVCDRSKITKPRIVGAPDLVIEIVSESNWFMDIFVKKRKYRNAGVREYWVIIPDQKRVMVYDFKNSSDEVEYTFEDEIPVGIWDGKCKVDMNDIYDEISFLMD